MYALYHGHVNNHAMSDVRSTGEGITFLYCASHMPQTKTESFGVILRIILSIYNTLDRSARDSAGTYL